MLTDGPQTWYFAVPLLSSSFRDRLQESGAPPPHRGSCTSMSVPTSVDKRSLGAMVASAPAVKRHHDDCGVDETAGATRPRHESTRSPPTLPLSVSTHVAAERPALPLPPNNHILVRTPCSIPRTIPRKTPGTTPQSPLPAAPTLVTSPRAPQNGPPAFPADPRNATRASKWASLLVTVFLADPGRDRESVEELCTRIVAAIPGDSQEAKDTFLTLMMNLKDPMNTLLRERVVRGEVLVEALVRMDECELINPERRRQLDAEFQMRAKDTNLTEIRKAVMTTSTLFACPSCKARDCSWTQKQTRSGDEPMTVFCTCNRCGYLWKRY